MISTIFFFRILKQGLNLFQFQVSTFLHQRNEQRANRFEMKVRRYAAASKGTTRGQLAAF
jgi:hypothetical protein